ncbi:hypothetical protein GGS24DRAFT_481461 [Hypoxylon argillaceum]|nr:hypothetical protein GGS24DRAFT_481461 [Hypoxylon argillaceum]
MCPDGAYVNPGCKLLSKSVRACSGTRNRPASRPTSLAISVAILKFIDLVTIEIVLWHFPDSLSYRIIVDSWVTTAHLSRLLNFHSFECLVYLLIISINLSQMAFVAFRDSSRLMACRAT